VMENSTCLCMRDEYNNGMEGENFCEIEKVPKEFIYFQ
jgi:hypothetical protein